MALIACPECQGRASSLAVACPHCGYPVARLSGEEEPERTLLEVSPALYGNNPFKHFAVALLCIVLVGIVLYVKEWLTCRATRLTVTTKRTILRSGIFSKETNEVRHKDIRNIQVHQGWVDRMFNVGFLELSSAGQADVEVAVHGVPDPQGIASLIRDQQ